MNEREIKEAEALYKIEEMFGNLGDEMFDERTKDISLLLKHLWTTMNELGITNEAARHALRYEFLNTISVRFRYECSILADRLREDFRGSIEGDK